jgi:hypothetical protein
MHNEKLYNLCSCPDIVRMSRSRKMRQLGHLECMGEKRNAYKVLIRKPERRYRVEYLGIDRRVMLKCIIKKQDMRVRLRIGTVAGSWEHGNEPSGSIK